MRTVRCSGRRGGRGAGGVYPSACWNTCLPLKSFLLKNTKNDKVNNWGVELASKYTLNLEYVKGVKNTLADTMSRLVTLDPDIILVKEPEGYQFGKQIGLN